MSKFFIAIIAFALPWATRAAEPKIEVVRKTQTVAVSGAEAGGKQAAFALEIPRVMRWTELVWVNETILQEQDVIGWGTCEDYSCSDSGEGQSELWNKFYSAPKDKKPKALSEAIRGVGESTAEKLVAAQFFSKKPRSWGEFGREIDRAVNMGIIDKGIRSKVLSVYAQDNIRNLGYQAAQCTKTSYPCETVTGTRLVPVQVAKQVEREFEKVLESRTRQFVMTITNAQLQSFENETIEITAGMDDGDVSVSAGPFTNYQFSFATENGVTKILLNGVARNLVSLPSGAVSGGRLVKKDGKVILSVSADSQYIPSTGEDKLVVKYVAQTCNVGWFGCKKFQDYETADAQTVAITDSNAEITINGVGAGKRVWVTYSFARQNSKLYNGEYSREVTTNTLDNK